MNKEIQQAKFHGFQLGISIALQLQNRGDIVKLDSAIKLAREIADGHFTTSDPEITNPIFDDATEGYCRDLAIKSIEVERQHASDVCEGLVSIVNSCLEDDQDQ